MSDPALATDAGRLAKLTQDLAKLDLQIRETISVWESTESDLQSLDQEDK